MSGDLAALMALRVQGIASPERAAAALGSAPDEAKQVLSALVDRELVTERGGRLAGYVLTPLGLSALDELLAAEGLRSSDEMSDCYERFISVDRDVKLVATRSQTEGAAAAIDDLVALHDRARVCLRKIGRIATRYVPYGDRLTSCVDRLLDGDHSAFTKPSAESYHQVWWELHQDLLLTLGKERED